MFLVYRLAQIKFTKIILLKITNNSMISHEVIIILHNCRHRILYPLTTQAPVSQ